MNTEGAQPSRLHFWALFLVCLAAFALRFQGINWPAFHPDEPTIGTWMDRVARGLSLKDKLYAGGFFHMAKPAIRLSRGYDYTSNILAYRRGLKDRARRTEDNPIMVARWFNVWAGTLVCLAAYLLVRRITRSPWAGVLGAALLGLAQYPVEHSHYGETDIAMLLTLTAALWLIAVTAATRRKIVFVLAALAGGYAAGTKFTLVVLLPVIAALSVTFDPRALSWKACLRAGGLLLAGLLFFLLGFLTAMPEAADADWFLKSLAYEKARVFGETALNLGPLRGDARIKPAIHAWAFLNNMGSLGWGWLALAITGLPCLAMRDFRRFWTVILLFPGLFLIYWIYLAPWVRSQEFMAFLPCLAALAALPLVALWRSGPGFRRPAAILLAAFAIVAGGINGCRTASLFEWTDTRLLAQQWLLTRLPEQRTVAVENYADFAWADTGRLPLCINKIEKTGLADVLARDARYLLRTASNSGRGLLNPLTGSLYPAPQALFDEFLRNSERLRVWAPLAPQGLATFVSPAIELYGLKRFPRGQAINLALPRPLWLNNYYDDEQGRQTFFPIGGELGPATGLLIDCQPRAIAVGGPEAPQGPVYLVINTAERPAAVDVRGFGRRRRATLDPYDAAILPLERPPWLPRPGQFEKITLCTKHVDGILRIPCFARLAFSLSEAARICLDLDDAGAFWRTFSEEDLRRACDPATAYLLAVRSARWSLAAQLEAAAGRVETALAKLARADSSAARINGSSGYYYDEFARSRLLAGEIAAINYLDLTDPVRPEPGRAPIYEAVLELPVRLARGRYTFCGEVMVKAEQSDSGQPDSAFEFYCGRPERIVARHAPDRPDNWTPLAFDFQATRESPARFIVRSRAPARLYFDKTEIRWSLAAMLDSVKSDLAAARAAQAVAGGKYAEARQRLAGLDQETFRWNELEIRQLDLAGARGLGDQEAGRQAARRLLELAPGDYAGLRTLAATAPEFQAAASELEGNLKKPVEFAGHMRLVGFSLQPAGRKVRCVWEAAKNETPPMAASFWIRRHGKWRRKQAQNLSERQWLAKGERVAVEAQLNDAFADYSPDALALGLESAVQWHPGVLPVAGSREAIVPFAELLRR